MKKVVLIRTPLVVESFLTSNIPVPDIGTAYLCAVAKQAGHDCTVIDAAGLGLGQLYPIKNTNFFIQGIDANKIIALIPLDTEVIAVSCMLTSSWIYDLYLLRKIRKKFPHQKLIIGGEHVTAAYDYILKNHPEVDVCVLGEGEETFVELLNCYQNNQSIGEVKGIAFRANTGEVRLTLPRNRVKPSTLPWPNWDHVPLDNYFKANQGINSNSKKSLIMLATRGCPHVCGFCTNDFMWQAKWFARDPIDVVNEIKHYKEKYQIEHIDFVDLTILINKEWMNQFCDLIISEKLNITWAIPIGTRTEGMDKNLLIKMKESGLTRLLYAAESGDDETLKKIEKNLVISRFNRIVKETVELGIITKINFIIGFPGQNSKQLWSSYKMLVKMAFIGVNDLITLAFVPYPGTKLYKELKLNFDFSAPNFKIPMNNNISNPISWIELYSNFELKMLMILFNGSFYSLQYIFRPHRILQSFYRMIILRKPLTNFESIIFNFFKKKDITPLEEQDLTAY